MKFLYWIPLLILPLTGCQSNLANTGSYATPYDNPYNLPPPGTVIELHQALSFSPGNSRSNIQNGAGIGQGRYDRFQPMCQFYLYESKEAMKARRTIEPDSFTIIKSFQRIDYTLAKPVEVAFVSVGGPRLFPYDDDPGLRTLETTMRLRSEKQPQVHELRCMMDNDPYSRRFVTINQMIETLGDVATLHLPGVAQ
jgi:hypothetical protein